MQMPNVFIAGVPKSGTSALAMCLAQHPQIAVSAIKEPNYFNTDFAFGHFKTRAAYLRLFETNVVGEPQPLRCDSSILYAWSDVAAARIAEEAAPGAKAIIVLRDPIDVMHAWFGQMCYTGNEPIREFERALAAEPGRAVASHVDRAVGLAARCPKILRYRELVSYGEQVRRFQNHLSADRVLVLLYDDLIADTDRTLNSVFKFLGADPGARPGLNWVNGAKQRRAPHLHRFIKRLAAGPSRRCLPARWRHELINVWDRLTSVAAPRQPVATAVRGRLVEELREGVLSTSRLLQRDLDHWLRP